MQEKEHKPKRELGLITATSLVVGNMIGCGLYVIPIALSKLGSVSLFGWVLASLGAVFIGLIFARLSHLLPQQGGLFAYTRDAFGNYAAFQVAWHYWALVWIGNASIVLGILAYLEPMFPLIAESPAFKFFLGLSILWSVTFINWRGVGLAGVVQLVTVVLKLSPILLIVIAGFFAINMDNYTPFNISDEGTLGAVGMAASIAMWAYIGVESASIPARYVKNPSKNIPRATLFGVALACSIYIVAAIVLVGVVPNSLLQESSAPYITAAQQIFSPDYIGGISIFITIGVVISMLGGLNGWVMLQAQMPYAAALTDLFPKAFKKLSKHDTPGFGLFFSSALVSVLIGWSCFFEAKEALILFIKFASFAVMVCYIFTVLSNVLLLKHHVKGYRLTFYDFILTALALAYLTWGLLGIDIRIKLIGLPLFLLSSAFYVWIRYSISPHAKENNSSSTS